LSGDTKVRLEQRVCQA